MPNLIETLAEELERPRDVTRQVSDHIWGTYDIDRDAVGSFIDTRLQDLEDYEHDLILSPLFTPKLADQIVFAELLGQGSVPKAEWPALTQQLSARPTRAQLVTSDGARHAVILREVLLERYVHRLRLDGSVPDAVWRLLDQEPFAVDRATLKAISRRAIWDSEARRNILATYLTAAGHHKLYQPGDGILFLQLAEDYKPVDLPHLMERIPLWQEALRQEIDTADNPKPFFSGAVQANHGFDRDQRQPDNSRMALKKIEFQFLARLHQLLMD